MSASPAITALAPWFGSKRTLAAKIIAAIGPHRSYWEPFCGSMAVLIAKEPSAMETVNDLHGDLINLARVIQLDSLGSQLYRRLRRTLMSEKLHIEAAGRYRARGYGGDDEPSVDRAYDYFLCAWLGRNGVAGTNSYNQGFCVRYTANGGHAAKRFTSAIESIPAWRQRIRNVTILCRDAFELLPRIDDEPRTAIYIDSPYIVKGAKYVHDFTHDDHERLAVALRRFKRSRVVVSYYQHERLADLYPGWTQIDCSMTKAMVSQGRRDAKNTAKAPEVLLVNSGSKELF